MSSNLIDIVNALESKIEKLVQKCDSLEKQNIELKATIENLNDKSGFQEDQIRQWEEKYTALKNANAILGSEKYRRETKLKINSLIKEIDVCIAQLSE
ncbi:hypothetical protein ACFSTE_20860 [Aquimarina hainanensis]|uniref:Uncharacterized protein n=1 Tax=Aquimarina hainanensis TaxID=1578017 RepID=A0ABW5NCG5_9FLAO|nr:hypothetical protein HN014_20525 [Aquimarina sp. TRL1]